MSAIQLDESVEPAPLPLKRSCLLRRSELSPRLAIFNFSPGLSVGGRVVQTLKLDREAFCATTKIGCISRCCIGTSHPGTLAGPSLSELIRGL
jgi:hypothetical protein